MASLSAYGGNPHADINPNADHGWGGYQWQAGVPAGLLGYAEYKGIRVQCRKELTVLFSLALAIAREVHGYIVYTSNPNGNGENWGPWGYENRAISGTNTASNHSKGKAMDWNAPRNPYATGSRFQSDFPPAMVADLESIGLYWGGRYGDAMHWEFAFTPADVPRFTAQAAAILRRAIPSLPDPAPTTTPTPTPVEDDSMSAADVADLKQYIDAKLADRTAGSHSVFDELSYAVNQVIMPQLNDVQSRVRGGDPRGDMLQLLTEKVAALEARIFNRDKGSQSIVDEIHYGNDMLAAKIDGLPKA
jgi:hypothetical protein